MVRSGGKSTWGGDFLAMLMWGGDTTHFEAHLTWDSEVLAMLKGMGDVQHFYHFTWGGGGMKRCTLS